jgi:hypothetical protein
MLAPYEPNPEPPLWPYGWVLFGMVCGAALAAGLYLAL